MGYYTSYRLGVKSTTAEMEVAIIKDLRSTNENARYALDEEGYTQEACKWYDCVDDMNEFSKKYPEVLFTMSGEGEESGDIWEHHFKNGKSQLCQAIMTFPPYDENKLK